MIPNGWRSAELGDIFKLTSGKTKPNDLRDFPSEENQYPVYGGNGVMGFSSQKLLENPYLIIGRVGEYCGTVRNVTSNCWITDNALYIKDLLDPNVCTSFLTYKLEYFDLGRLKKKGGQPLISQAPIYKTKISLPLDKREQQKIAKILSTWDEAIEKLEKVIEAKKLRKKGLMQQLLTGKKRFDGFNDEWKTVKQGDIATFYNGRAYKLKEWEEEGTPVIRLQNLTGSGKDFYYSTMELPEDKYCHKDDLLYMWSASFGPHIWKGEKAIYHYHIWKIVCDEKLLDKMFFYYILDFETEQWKSGSSNGMGLLHITKGSMEKFEIDLPSLDEQKKISEFLSTVDRDIKLEEEKLKTFNTQKKGLMQQLLTGKKRVKID